MIEITDQAHLEALPDGSLITWLRIPGDDTSRAVAFVHHEDQEEVVDTRVVVTGVRKRRVTWVSPGGWAPQSPENVGVTYPAHVIVLGILYVTDDPPIVGGSPLDPAWQLPIAPTMPDWPTITGGTWARETALKAAATVRAGDGANSRDWVSAKNVTDMAEVFEEWLNRELDVVPQPEAPPEPSDYQRLHALANEIEWAQNNHMVLHTIGTTALRHYANRHMDPPVKDGGQ